MLLAFGADVSQVNLHNQTPLDIAKHLGGDAKELLDLLHSVPASPNRNMNESSGQKRCRPSSSEDGECDKDTDGKHREDDNHSGMINTGAAAGDQGLFPIDNMNAVPMRGRLCSQNLSAATLKDMEDGNTVSTLYERLQQCINIALSHPG